MIANGNVRDLSELIKYGQVCIKPVLYTQNNYGYRTTTETCERTAIVVVGCGGTGGRIIPLLAQHAKNHNNTIDTMYNHSLYLKHKMKLILIDNDTVN